MSSVSRSKPPGASTIVTALIYTRVSSDEQAREGLSLDAQLTESRRYAAHKGWLLGTEYQDILTGTRDDRPQYQRLLADIRGMSADGANLVVVVAALDRFGRQLLERVRCREELKRLGVTVHSVREGGEVSDLVANILASVAEEEVRRLGERVRASKQYVIANGYMPQGAVKWGYILRPATDAERATGAPKTLLDVNDETAPYVRELFQRVANGTTVRQVTRWVHGLPQSAKQGKRLGFSTVQRILRSPTYIARYPSATGDVLSSPLMRWPALIDDDIWLKVQQFIDDHAVHHHQASQRYLLTGFLKCARCGGLISGRRMIGGRNVPYYACVQEKIDAGVTCSWAASARFIDAAVIELVGQVLAPFASTDPRFLGELEKAWRQLQQPDEVGIQRDRRITALRRESDKARQRLADAATLLVDGVLDRAGYEALRDRTREDLRATEEELARLVASASPSGLPLLSEVLTFVGQWRSLLQQADVELQREVLAVLVQRVDTARIAWGRYGVKMVWTPLGKALADSAGVGDTYPSDAVIEPLAMAKGKPSRCPSCGTEFPWEPRRVYCRRACKLREWRKRRTARDGTSAIEVPNDGSVGTSA